MARKPPTKGIKGGASGAKNSKSIFGGLGSGGLLSAGLGLGATALSVASLTGAFNNLGLPPLADLFSNPLYLGAAALAAFILLK